MANEKTSQYPAAAALDGSEFFDAIQGGDNVKVSPQQVKDFVGGFEHEFTEDVDAGGFKITNAADPTDDQDYATKKYVDDNEVAGATDIDGLADGYNNGPAENLLMGSSTQGNSITSGTNNTGFGLGVLNAITSAARNAAFGMSALSSLVSGIRNAAFGMSALNSLNTGEENTAVGFRSAWNATSASRNVVIGALAADALSTGSDNLIIGYNVNMPDGSVDGYLNIGGAIRIDRHNQSASGSENLIIGNNASGSAITSGVQNTIVGVDAGNSINGGNANVILGGFSGRNITTGTGNILIGTGDTSLVTGGNNILIGSGTDVSGAGANNELNIGNLLKGNLSSKVLELQGDVDANGKNITGADNVQMQTLNVSTFMLLAHTANVMIRNFADDFSVEVLSLNSDDELNVGANAGTIRLKVNTSLANGAIFQGRNNADNDDFQIFRVETDDTVSTGDVFQDPTLPQQLATKQYVDDNAGGGSSPSTLWTERDVSFLVEDAIQDVAYDQTNDVWVGVVDNGRIIRSLDGGVTWAEVTHDAGAGPFTTIAWLPGEELFIMGGAFAGPEYLATSPDGETWTVRASDLTDPPRHVVINNAGTLAMSIQGTGTCVTSPDGATWTTRTSTGLDPTGMAHVGGTNLWVIGGGTSIKTSGDDGVTWTSRTSNFTAGQSIQSIASEGPGNNVVAVGSAGQAVYSTNGGTTWVSNTQPNMHGDDMYAAAWISDGFLAFGTFGTIAIGTGSPAGQFWRGVPTYPQLRQPVDAMSFINAVDDRNGAGKVVAFGYVNAPGPFGTKLITYGIT